MRTSFVVLALVASVFAMSAAYVMAEQSLFLVGVNTIRGPVTIDWFYLDYGPSDSVTITVVVSNLSNRYVENGYVELRAKRITSRISRWTKIATLPLPDMRPGGAAAVKGVFVLRGLSDGEPKINIEAGVYGLVVKR